MASTDNVDREIIPLHSRSSEQFSANIPGSKSLTNRALILAAMHPGRTVIDNALHADDTDLLAECLGSFEGLTVEGTEDGYEVERRAGVLGAPDAPIYIGAAGTPARFLLSFAADAEGATEITGNARLSERPMGHLLDAMRRLGIGLSCEGRPDCLPVRVTGSPSAGTDWSIDGSVSSQFVSSLLLHAARRPPGSEPVTVRVSGHLVSRPYVEMTEQAMREAGIDVEALDGDAWRVVPGEPTADRLEVETDASGMSYFLAAAAMTGTSVRVDRVGRLSRQGDVGFAEVLGRMGAEVAIEDDHIVVTGTGTLRGIEVDMETMPDTVLTLAAVAAFADGPTRVTNIANLRVKECDRIAAIVNELGRMGVPTSDGEDWVEIRPDGRPGPARVETYDDHRVAMAFALVGLLVPGIVITDPDCVRKSFPTFWNEFDRFAAHHVAARHDAA